jgi:hypothetical protein
VGPLDQSWTNRAEKHVFSARFLDPPNGQNGFQDTILG